MGFRIVHGDILDFKADAIVNPTDRWYSGGGGVDYQIHNAVGPALRKSTSRLSQLHLGEAKVTDGFNLKARYKSTPQRLIGMVMSISQRLCLAPAIATA